MTESAKHAVMDAMAVGESVTLTCVAVDTPTCARCFFVGMDCEMLAGRFRCMAAERADGRDVIFVEIDMEGGKYDRI